MTDRGTLVGMSEAEAEVVSKNKRHRKDKPWDTEDIDHWKIEPFGKDEMKHPLLEESLFSVLFPRYLEKELKAQWPIITKIFEGHGIACELNLVEGSMTVKTTRKTWDPYMIVKARDMIKLLARSVDLTNASKVLQDGMACDIIKIGNILRNRERFIKRRMRLVGPNGNTLKAIELLTQCHVRVQGNTVSVIGTYKGLKEVRRIVLDCMRNIHPIYHIKELMIKRELAKDERLKNENWDRFLPKFKKISEARKKQKPESKSSKKKPYTPFPPAPTPRQEDLLIETGEYFLKPEEREAKVEKEKQENREAKRLEKEAKRALLYQPPDEDEIVNKKSGTDKEDGKRNSKASKKGSEREKKDTGKASKKESKREKRDADTKREGKREKKEKKSKSKK